MEKKSVDFAAMPQTALRVITSPAAFFREMPKTGGVLEPLVFMMVMAVVMAVVNAVLGLAGLKFVLGVGMAIAGVIITPIIAAIGGFIGAAILFVIWKLMGSQEPYETAYRCIAYLSALMPVLTVAGIIPYAGLLITFAAWTYFLVTASIEAHKILSRKAWVVFGIIGAALFLISLGAQMTARTLQPKMEQQLKEMQKGSEEMQKKLEEMQRRMQKQ